jgi:hypothetical protein
MKKQNAQEQVAEFLRSNPASSLDVIIAGTKLTASAVNKALAKLIEDGAVTNDGDGESLTYSTTEETHAVEVEDAEASVSSKGRNNQKYKFNGEEYGKGRLVLAVIRQYCEEHRPTLKQVLEAFPAELLKRFGPCRELQNSIELSGARPRFFNQNEADYIILKDKKTLVVCNQWTSDNIQPFLKHAKALGYKIK